MSYVSTYDKRKPTPKSIALAFGVHAVVIGAAIAMPGIEIIPKEQDDVEAIQLTKPEPLKEKIEQQEQQKPIPREQRIKLPVPPIEDLPKAPETEIDVFSGGEEWRLAVAEKALESLSNRWRQLSQHQTRSS